MNYTIPHNFVLKQLYPLRPRIVKMLGGIGLYKDDLLLMFLRDSTKNPEFNGVFVATQPTYFQALQEEIHTSKMDFDLDGSHNSWIFISEDVTCFEEKVAKACILAKAGDERIGK